MSPKLYIDPKFIAGSIIPGLQKLMSRADSLSSRFATIYQFACMDGSAEGFESLFESIKNGLSDIPFKLDRFARVLAMALENYEDAERAVNSEIDELAAYQQHVFGTKDASVIGADPIGGVRNIDRPDYSRIPRVELLEEQVPDQEEIFAGVFVDIPDPGVLEVEVKEYSLISEMTGTADIDGSVQEVFASPAIESIETPLFAGFISLLSPIGELAEQNITVITDDSAEDIPIIWMAPGEAMAIGKDISDGTGELPPGVRIDERRAISTEALQRVKTALEEQRGQYMDVYLSEGSSSVRVPLTALVGAIGAITAASFRQRGNDEEEEAGRGASPVRFMSDEEETAFEAVRVVARSYTDYDSVVSVNMEDGKRIAEISVREILDFTHILPPQIEKRIAEIPVREILDFMHIVPPQIEESLNLSIPEAGVAPVQNIESAPRLREITMAAMKSAEYEYAEINIPRVASLSIPAVVILEIMDILPVDFSNGRVRGVIPPREILELLSPPAGHALRMFQTLPFLSAEHEQITITLGKTSVTIPQAEFLGLMHILPADGAAPWERATPVIHEINEAMDISAAAYSYTDRIQLSQTAVWGLQFINSIQADRQIFEIPQGVISDAATIDAPDIARGPRPVINSVTIEELMHISPPVFEFTDKIILSPVNVPAWRDIDGRILPDFRSAAGLFDPLSAIEADGGRDGADIDEQAIADVVSIQMVTGGEGGEGEDAMMAETLKLAHITEALFEAGGTGLIPVYVDDARGIEPVAPPDEIVYPTAAVSDEMMIAAFMPVPGGVADIGSAKTLDDWGLQEISFIDDEGVESTSVLVSPSMEITAFDAEIIDDQLHVNGPVSGPVDIAPLSEEVRDAIVEIISNGKNSGLMIESVSYSGKIADSVKAATINGEKDIIKNVFESLAGVIANAIANLAMSNSEMKGAKKNKLEGTKAGATGVQDVEDDVTGVNRDDTPVYVPESKREHQTVEGAGAAGDDNGHSSYPVRDQNVREIDEMGIHIIDSPEPIPTYMSDLERAKVEGVTYESPSKDAAVYGNVTDGSELSGFVSNEKTHVVYKHDGDRGEAVIYNHDTYVTETGGQWVQTTYENKDGETVVISQPKGLLFYLRRLFEMMMTSGRAAGNDDEEAPVAAVAKMLKMTMENEPPVGDRDRLSVMFTEWKDSPDDFLYFAGSLVDSGAAPVI